MVEISEANVCICLGSLAAVIVQRNRVMGNLKDVLVANGNIPDKLAEMERKTKSVLNRIFRNLKFIPSSAPRLEGEPLYDGGKNIWFTLG